MSQTKTGTSSSIRTVTVTLVKRGNGLLHTTTNGRWNYRKTATMINIKSTPSLGNGFYTVCHTPNRPFLAYQHSYRPRMCTRTTTATRIETKV